MSWVFSPLPPLSYECLAVDPPWPFDLYSNKGNRKSAAAHYRLMTHEQIRQLPVGQLAQRNCLLLLWTPAPALPEALSTMRAWGFVYKSNLIWRKVYPSGKVRMGTGYWARSMHEQVLIGTIGRPTKLSAFPSCFDGIAREHSRKPEEFFSLIERHTDGLRRAEVFARVVRPGWDAWGDETGKFATGKGDADGK
jgi:N6-adenosine-specific RNA methylase IME4